MLNRLLVSDSEVDEMSVFTGKNVYYSTTAGALTGTFTTTSYTHETTGVAINTSNNHVFISDDAPKDKVFEISLGPDNTYCTGDDTVTTTLVNALYGATDAETWATARTRSSSPRRGCGGLRYPARRERRAGRRG